MSRDFAEVGWRRELGARKPRSGVRNQRNEAGCRHRRKRGAVGRPRYVWWPRCHWAVRALWLCGTEKCPFDFATDGDSADSENKARMDLLLSFSTADAVDIRNELTRVVRPHADRLVGPVVALAEQNAIDLAPAVVASSHTCKETFRGISLLTACAHSGSYLH